MVVHRHGERPAGRCFSVADRRHDLKAAQELVLGINGQAGAVERKRDGSSLARCKGRRVSQRVFICIAAAQNNYARTAPPMQSLVRDGGKNRCGIVDRHVERLARGAFSVRCRDGDREISEIILCRIEDNTAPRNSSLRASGGTDGRGKNDRVSVLINRGQGHAERVLAIVHRLIGNRAQLGRGIVD